MTDWSELLLGKMWSKGTDPLCYIIEANKKIWSVWTECHLPCFLPFPCSGIVVANSFKTKASLPRDCKIENWQLTQMCAVSSKEDSTHWLGPEPIIPVQICIPLLLCGRTYASIHRPTASCSEETILCCWFPI